MTDPQGFVYKDHEGHLDTFDGDTMGFAVFTTAYVPQRTDPNLNAVDGESVAAGYARFYATVVWNDEAGRLDIDEDDQWPLVDLHDEPDVAYVVMFVPGASDSLRTLVSQQKYLPHAGTVDWPYEPVEGVAGYTDAKILTDAVADLEARTVAGVSAVDGDYSAEEIAAAIEGFLSGDGGVSGADHVVALFIESIASGDSNAVLYGSGSVVARSDIATRPVLVVSGTNFGLRTMTASGALTAGATLSPGDVVVAAGQGYSAVATTVDGSTVNAVTVGAVAADIEALSWPQIHGAHGPAVLALVGDDRLYVTDDVGPMDTDGFSITYEAVVYGPDPDRTEEGLVSFCEVVTKYADDVWGGDQDAYEGALVVEDGRVTVFSELVREGDAVPVTAGEWVAGRFYSSDHAPDFAIGLGRKVTVRHEVRYDVAGSTQQDWYYRVTGGDEHDLTTGGWATNIDEARFWRRLYRMTTSGVIELLDTDTKWRIGCNPGSWAVARAEIHRGIASPELAVHFDMEADWQEDGTVESSEVTGQVWEPLNPGTPPVRVSTYPGEAGDAGAVSSVAGRTGAVVLTADDLTDGSTNHVFTATDDTKLGGIASGATANSSDVTLLDRANHTGSQAQSTVTNLVTDLAAKVPTSRALAGLDLSADRSAATLRTALALVIGTDVMAQVAGSNDDIMQRKSGAWTFRTPAQVKTDLVLVKADVGLGSVTNDAQVTKATVTTKGDLIVATASATPDRLGVGAAGTTPVANSNETTGIGWVGTAAPIIFESAQQVALAPYVSTTGALTSGRIIYYRFRVPRRLTFDRFGVNHISGVSTTGDIFLGIYSPTAVGGGPGSRLVDITSGGTINPTTAAAQKLISGSWTLDPGDYWYGIVGVFAGGTAPTLAFASTIGAFIFPDSTGLGNQAPFQNSQTGVPSSASGYSVGVSTAPVMLARPA